MVALRLKTKKNERFPLRACNDYKVFCAFLLFHGSISILLNIAFLYFSRTHACPLSLWPISQLLRLFYTNDAWNEDDHIVWTLFANDRLQIAHKLFSMLKE